MPRLKTSTKHPKMADVGIRFYIQSGGQPLKPINWKSKSLVQRFTYLEENNSIGRW